MGRLLGLITARLERVVGKLSASTAFGLGALVYLGFGLALPLGVGAGTFELVALNLFGALWGFVIILAWMVVYQERLHRRLLLEWTTDLRQLSASEFEWLVGELLRREGWEVEETGRPDAADGNIDLRARRNGREVVVQCKAWKSTVVGVDEVRELGGTIARERLALGSGMLVTLSTFSSQAIADAQDLKIELVAGQALIDRIEKVRGGELCPDCGARMVLSHSRRGWWLRCPRYPLCTGKRDLHSASARAVDLLLDPALPGDIESRP